MRAGGAQKTTTFGWALSLVLFALSAVSCTNNLSSGTSSSSAINGGGNGYNSNSNYILNLSNVVKDSTNPTTTLDLIGDGSGAMGKYCTSSSGSLSSAGPSTCSCTYSFTSPSQGSQQVDVDTTYQEQNLIECLYTQIPSDVTTVSVSVHVTTQNAYSNPFSFNISNTNGSNPTSASNFTLVTRWQCKDIVSILYPGSQPFGSTNAIYDPLQSQDPSLTYPLNFYTTNLGGSLEAYIAANLQGQWNCPSNPNDPNFGLNYNLYSVGPDSAGSYQIYPTSGSAFDRSTFYVSTTKTGVYTIPLDSYTAPTLVDDGAAPLGYAAAPIPTGPNTESCPDTVALPAGYHWAKLWLFRASLPDRYYLNSSAMSQAGTIACDPGQDSSGKMVFPDCSTVAGSTTASDDVNSIATGEANAVNGAFPSGELVNRVIAGEGNGSQEMCVQLSILSSSIAGNPDESPTCSPDSYCFLESSFGPGATYDSATSAQFPTDSNLAMGTDLWKPIGGVFSDTSPFSGTTQDPLDLHGVKWSMQNAPKDMAPTSMDLDNPAGSGSTGSTSRYDFVFVVSPETVMAADMENSSTSTDYPYIPFRFPNASDCLSPNPNNPLTPGDCNPSKIIHYGLKLHDVNTNGDPPANDPSDPPMYPMCVLQPN